MRVTGSNGNDNSKTRCFKIVSFSMNDIIGYSYFMQLIVEMIRLVKNLLRFKQLKVTKITVTISKLTLNVLNSISFLLTID